MLRIDHVDVRNVMRFESLEADFAPEFTVIIGENGAGKTTLLTLLRRALAVWTPQKRRSAQVAGLVRETLHISNGTPYRAQHQPWHLHVSGIAPGGGELRYFEGDGRAVVGNVAANRLHREAEANLDVRLPVLAYFSPWREPPRARKPRVEPAKPARRLDGYEDALDLHADFHDFAAWFKGFEMQRIEGGAAVPAVEAARRAIVACLPGCTDLRWVPVLNEIVVTIDGETFPVWRLSDGFRTMLALVGELTWRAAVLNPGHGGDIEREVEGVVLIDEIDLHLHPRWQRRVVDDLRRAFPRVQFIATTHSPFVVQSMRAAEVINLDGHAPMEYWREGIEDITTQSMGVEDGQVVPRSGLYRELESVATEYYRLLDTRPADDVALAEKKARLDELEAAFTDSPALAAFLRMQRLAEEPEP